MTPLQHSNEANEHIYYSLKYIHIFLLFSIGKNVQQLN